MYAPAFALASASWGGGLCGACAGGGLYRASAFVILALGLDAALCLCSSQRLDTAGTGCGAGLFARLYERV